MQPLREDFRTHRGCSTDCWRAKSGINSKRESRLPNPGSGLAPQELSRQVLEVRGWEPLAGGHSLFSCCMYLRAPGGRQPVGRVRQSSSPRWKPPETVGPEQSKSAKGKLGWSERGVGRAWDGHMGRGKNRPQETYHGSCQTRPAFPSPMSWGYHLLHVS